MACCLVPQSRREAGVDQTDTPMSRWKVVRKWGPRMVRSLVPQPRRETGADQEDTPMGAGCPFPRPRGEGGSDQDNTQVGPGTAAGRNPVFPGNSAIVATVARGQAARIGWPAPLVASFARWARCSKGKTPFPLVVCTIVPVARVSPLLLESELWPTYLWVATREPLAPCWESPPAVPLVWLHVPVSISIDGCCLPLSA